MSDTTTQTPEPIYQVSQCGRPWVAEIQSGPGHLPGHPHCPCHVCREARPATAHTAHGQPVDGLSGWTIEQLNHAHRRLRAQLADFGGMYGGRLHRQFVDITGELHCRALSSHKAYEYCAAGGHQLRCCISCGSQPVKA